MSADKKTNKIFITGALLMLVAIGYLLPTQKADAACTTQAECQAELNKINEEINKINSNIKVKDGEIKTISGEINKLTNEIVKTSGEIKKKDSLISNLRSDIVRKENSLGALNEKLVRERLSLEQIIRKRNQLDDATLFEVILSSKNISEFYEDAPSFAYVQDSLSESFKIIDDLRVNIYNEKSMLELKKEAEDNVKYSLLLEKNKIEGQKSDRDQVLAISKSDKASFEQLKKQREAEAKAIRAKMIQFQGSGVGGKSISFGEAYDYAKFASSKTGVRTAFIMAIMQQESGFGRNVGGCNLRDSATGDGIYISSGAKSVRNMVPGNFENFKKITTALGRDWTTTPISCVAIIGGNPYGYGGAMGYTQFIPNTWMSVEARVRTYLGAAVANPWNAQHAVMATAVFTKDLGAGAQTYSSELNAACRYYGSCSVYSYGAQVMAKAATIQKEIDKLERE
jgi:peptidoglycan hydrolase CwlO-like protein